MRWKDILLDLRDIIIEKAEDILTGFYHSAKESWDPGKMLLFGIVGIIAVIMIISNLLSGDKQLEPTPSAADESKVVKKKEEPRGEPTAEDAVLATEVAENFLKEYSTFEGANFGDRLERMKPYLTKELYKEMAQSIAAYGVKKSEFLSVDNRFIEPIGDGMLFWTGQITIKMDGKKLKILPFIKLKYEDGKWKVAEFDEEDNEADY